MLQSLNPPFSEEVRTPFSFGGGMQVLEWEQDSQCKQCGLSSICDGICENIKK